MKNYQKNIAIRFWIAGALGFFSVTSASGQDASANQTLTLQVFEANKIDISQRACVAAPAVELPASSRGGGDIDHPSLIIGKHSLTRLSYRASLRAGGGEVAWCRSNRYGKGNPFLRCWNSESTRVFRGNSKHPAG
jgi:hypothetical protein